MMQQNEKSTFHEFSHNQQLGFYFLYTRAELKEIVKWLLLFHDDLQVILQVITTSLQSAHEILILF